MDNLQEFKKAMGKTGYIALATSNDDHPNVRVVTIWYDTNQEGVIYFPTIRTSPKVAEFECNNRVAFTTLNGMVRVKEAIVTKTELTVEDIKAGILKNDSYILNTLKFVSADMFDVYEVRFGEALMTLGPNNYVTVKF